jgi:hypothetical protein
MECLNCGQPIPEERLEALPNVKFCVRCVDQYGPKKVGFMVYSHKTAPELVVIDGRDSEALRQAERANNRNR